jgi:hypothetical protein
LRRQHHLYLQQLQLSSSARPILVQQPLYLARLPLCQDSCRLINSYWRAIILDMYDKADDDSVCRLVCNGPYQKITDSNKRQNAIKSLTYT